MSSNVAILRDADHREAALLVRVEPREVQVRGQAGREAQEAKTTSSSPRACRPRRAPRSRRAPRRRQVQDHRDVVRARATTARSRPRAAPEVQAVASRCSGCRRARPSRRSPSALTPGWYSSRCPTMSTRAAARPRRPRARRRPTVSASGFSTKQCLPAPRRARRARRAWAPAWRARPRRARGRPAGRPGVVVRRRGERGAGTGQGVGRRRTASAARCPPSRRSCGPGSGPSSRGRRQPTRTGRSAIRAAPPSERACGASRPAGRRRGEPS